MKDPNKQLKNQMTYFNTTSYTIESKFLSG